MICCSGYSDLGVVPVANLLPVLRSAAARVTGAVVTPLVPSDYLDLVDPLRSGAALRARVVEVRPETRDAVTLVLRPGRGWAGHRAGQYVRLGVDVDGVRHWRAYSLTSPPRPDGCLTVTVKAIADGRVSGHLVRRARPGLLVHLDQAAGDFLLPDPAPRRTLFVTAGSGITPVMGLLRAGLASLPDVVVVHSAPTADDVVFGGELRALARAGALRLVERHTDRAGLLTPEALGEAVPDWRDRETWACGPTGLLDALEQLWASYGVADRLHTERFRPSVVVAGDGGAVTFASSGVRVEAAAATPLLDAGEAAGVLMPSGCRMGICFGCVAPLRAGAVRDLRTGVLTTTSDGEHVLVQTCVSAAAGDCVIDL
jgi:ferredoxin-NADP reductase